MEMLLMITEKRALELAKMETKNLESTAKSFKVFLERQYTHILQKDTSQKMEVSTLTRKSV